MKKAQQRADGANLRLEAKKINGRGACRYERARWNYNEIKNTCNSNEAPRPFTLAEIGNTASEVVKAPLGVTTF